jgi:hypothetical protein
MWPLSLRSSHASANERKVSCFPAKRSWTTSKKQVGHERKPPLKETYMLMFVSQCMNGIMWGIRSYSLYRPLNLVAASMSKDSYYVINIMSAGVLPITATTTDLAFPSKYNLFWQKNDEACPFAHLSSKFAYTYVFPFPLILAVLGWGLRVVFCNSRTSARPVASGYVDSRGL